MSKRMIRIRMLETNNRLGIIKDKVCLTQENDFIRGLIQDKLAEIVENDPNEAKFQRDKLVLETGKNNQLSQTDAEALLNVSPSSYDRIIGNKPTLEDVYHKYGEHIHLEDTNRIDIVLATALSKKLNGIPIWLILVGASGDAKTLQLNALAGFDTFYIQKMTPRTLVNGFQEKDKYPDLAPKLNNKLVVIRDFATLMKLPPHDKAEIWGQLRDLYDGFAGTTSGMGTDVKYEGLKITLLAGSTPAIDTQILVHQDLGTRELIYRLDGNEDKDDVMNRCMDNEMNEDKIKKELNEVTVNFLKNIKINRFELTKEQSDELKNMALYVSYMRATASYDGYSNYLLTNVVPEEPTRIIKQLKRLFICLKSLSPDYSDKKALKILWHLSRSSASPMRVRVLDFLLNKENHLDFSTSNIAGELKLGKSTCLRELNALNNLGIVTLRPVETNIPDREYYYWKLNLINPVLLNLKQSILSLSA